MNALEYAPLCFANDIIIKFGTPIFDACQDDFMKHFNGNGNFVPIKQESEIIEDEIADELLKGVYYFKEINNKSL